MKLYFLTSLACYNDNLIYYILCTVHKFIYVIKKKIRSNKVKKMKQTKSFVSLTLQNKINGYKDIFMRILLFYSFYIFVWHIAW
jgi:hypothetical protein